MFGKNPIAKARSVSDGYLLHSMWYTIQGEGPLAGRPAVFVRFAGCNLRCTFCDTDFSGGEALSLVTLQQEITTLAREHSCKLVVLTGGEPMLQPLTELILSFDPAEELYFQIETAGTVWPKNFEEVIELDMAEIVCSPKTPRLHPMLENETGVSAWKYIIRATEPLCPDSGLPYALTQPRATDSSAQLLFRPASITSPTTAHIKHPAPIYVQPCDEGPTAQGLLASRANMELAARIALRAGYRISLQTHKILGLD